jgi:hypothetical protein
VDGILSFWLKQKEEDGEAYSLGPRKNKWSAPESCMSTARVGRQRGALEHSSFPALRKIIFTISFPGSF